MAEKVRIVENHLNVNKSDEKEFFVYMLTTTKKLRMYSLRLTLLRQGLKTIINEVISGPIDFEGVSDFSTISYFKVEQSPFTTKNHFRKEKLVANSDLFCDVERAFAKNLFNTKLSKNTVVLIKEEDVVLVHGKYTLMEIKAYQLKRAIGSSPENSNVSKNDAKPKGAPKARQLMFPRFTSPLFSLIASSLSTVLESNTFWALIADLVRLRYNVGENVSSSNVFAQYCQGETELLVGYFAGLVALAFHVEEQRPERKRLNSPEKHLGKSQLVAMRSIAYSDPRLSEIYARISSRRKGLGQENAKHETTDRLLPDIRIDLEQARAFLPKIFILLHYLNEDLRLCKASQVTHHDLTLVLLCMASALPSQNSQQYIQHYLALHPFAMDRLRYILPARNAVELSVAKMTAQKEQEGARVFLPEQTYDSLKLV